MRESRRKRPARHARPIRNPPVDHSLGCLGWSTGGFSSWDSGWKRGMRTTRSWRQSRLPRACCRMRCCPTSPACSGWRPLHPLSRPCRGGRGAAALVGVVEAAALEHDAACGELTRGNSAAVGAYDFGMLAHPMGDLEHLAAGRAAIIVACHSSELLAWVWPRGPHG